MALSFVLTEVQEQKFAWVNIVPLSLDQNLFTFKGYFKLSITDRKFMENGNTQIIEILSIREERDHRFKACIISEFPRIFNRHAQNIEKIDSYVIRFKYNREEELREFFNDMIDYLWINQFINEFNLNLICCRFMGTYLYTDKDVVINFIENKNSSSTNPIAGIAKSNIPQQNTLTTLVQVNLLLMNGEFLSNFTIQFTTVMDSKSLTPPSNLSLSFIIKRC